MKSGIDDDTVTSFNVSESAADRQWMQVWTKTKGGEYLIECTQTYPANGRAFTGQNGALKSITLVNTLTSHQPTGSAIMKDMAPGADPVPTYSRLIFALERKVGEEWVSAEGVQYYIGHYVHGEKEADWRDFEEGKTLTTDSTGFIEVSKADYTFPFIQFMTDTVYVYGDPKMPTAEGTLRIREMLNESDSAWGTFAWNSLLETGEQFKPGWQADEGERTQPYDTIVNTNRTTKVRVGKQSSSAANTQFTFYLNQVIDVDWSKAKDGLNENNYKAAIKSSLPATNIQYYIWKQASENETTTRISGPHTIGEDGKFVIEAGQYAEFELPDKTIWTVEEDVTPGYYLDSMTTIEGMPYTIKLAENKTLISSAAGVIGDRISVTPLQKDWDVETELDKAQFSVVWFDSDGNSKMLSVDEYSIEPLYAPDAEGSFVVVITENATGLTATVTVNAIISYTVKYAVRIYGILTDDIEESGKKAGLTFGPATGANYTDNLDGHNLCGNGDDCISNKTWEEIIEIANTDPTVFTDCMNAGCVVSVPLMITGALAGKRYTMSGDGASALSGSIASKYRKWNDRDNNGGGWPASRIRATLNGKDDKLDSWRAGSDCLDVKNSLISAFPKELQEAIVAKAVKSDINKQSNMADVVPTYDKLWLFSSTEIFKSDLDAAVGKSNLMVFYKNKIIEGQQYTANRLFNITVKNYEKNNGYDENGNNGYWYLRSIAPDDGSRSCYILRGSIETMRTNTEGAIAPGFCIGSLPAPASKSIPDVGEYTVKYAVRIYGIEVDNYQRSSGDKAALTFGPAIGVSTHSYDGFNLCKREDFCISYLTWPEIIEYARANPHVFDECFMAGCVVSVPLNITGSLAGESYKGQMDDGYGASALEYSISKDYLKWNNDGFTTGGWYSSRIRATLNGKDDKTDIAGAAGLDCLDVANSLYAAFPKEIQSAIVAKEVKSEAVYNGSLTDDKITYDKLWLFSLAEKYGNDTSYPGYSSINSDKLKYPVYCYGEKVYDENGDRTNGWLRSIRSVMSVPGIDVFNLFGETSSTSISNAMDDFPLTPGFCIN